MTTGGRPSTDFTQEQLDAAKQALGEKVFASRAVAVLMKKLRLGRDVSYRLVDVARDEVFKSLSVNGATDPLTAQVLFLESVQANPRVKIRDKIAASSVMVRLLGMDRLARHLGSDPATVDEFLARLHAARLAAPSRN